MKINNKRIRVSLFLLALLSFCLAACDQANKDVPLAKPTKKSLYKSPIDLLISKAEQGDPKSEYDLAVKYVEGEELPKDFKKAKEWLNKAASNNYALAKYDLANFYSLSNIDADKQKSEQLFKEAFEIFKKESVNPESKATFYLGVMTFYGKGTIKDETLGLELIRRSAEAGNSYASLKLYKMYHMVVFNGLKQDLNEAVKWLLKSSYDGNAEAQHILAGYYYQGWVAYGPPIANDNDKKYLPDPYSNPYDLVEKDTSKALEFYQKAALQNYTASQIALAKLYYDGDKGIPKNRTKAIEWFHKAAIKGDAYSQFRVGTAYLTGDGVQINLTLGYAWINLVASREVDPDFVQNVENVRDLVRPKLPESDLSEAERLSVNWTVGRDLIASTISSSTNNDKPSKVATGTAFYISKDGHLVTNKHVIDGCLEMHLQGSKEALQILASDSVNDLALLKQKEPASDVATISSNPENIRQGQEIVVYGYPLNEFISAGGNLTLGVISALTGLGNNTNQIQITAPIQPGSSGSPVLDRKGNVIAVVNMKLSEKDAVKTVGSLPQNVNFAINGLTLKGFLDEKRVKYNNDWGLQFWNSSLEDIADNSRKSTVLVECWK